MESHTSMTWLAWISLAWLLAIKKIAIKWRVGLNRGTPEQVTTDGGTESIILLSFILEAGNSVRLENSDFEKADTLIQQE